jgi:hypothetical protein
MDYSLNVKRLRMKAVVDSIDGGNGPGSIELRDVNRVVLATLILTRPSFYLVGDDLQLCAPTTAFVAIAGQAVLGTISDGSGTLVIDEMTVGVDPVDEDGHDFEIVLDDNNLEVGKQVTIVSATIEHG